MHKMKLVMNEIYQFLVVNTEMFWFYLKDFLNYSTDIDKCCRR